MYSKRRDDSACNLIKDMRHFCTSQRGRRIKRKAVKSLQISLDLARCHHRGRRRQREPPASVPGWVRCSKLSESDTFHHRDFVTQRSDHNIVGRITSARCRGCALWAAKSVSAIDHEAFGSGGFNEFVHQAIELGRDIYSYRRDFTTTM